MITKEKMPWSFIKFSQHILKENIWRSVWRICMCVFGLKGSTKRGVNLETELLRRPFSARKYTPATPWPVDPSFMYLLWTVLQFPASSYHMCVVQLVLKGPLSTTRLIESISIQPVGCTMSLAAIAQVMQLCTCISAHASVNGHTAKLVVAAMYEFGLDNSNVFH